MIEFSKESDVYINTDGTLTSYLYLAEINDSIIEFSLLVLENDVLVDLIKSKQAISPGLYQDPEIDEDEEGVAYPAQQYFYETADCWISVRIDIDTNNKAKLNIGECQELQKITHELDMKLFKKKE